MWRVVVLIVAESAWHEDFAFTIHLLCNKTTDWEIFAGNEQDPEPPHSTNPAALTATQILQLQAPAPQTEMEGLSFGCMAMALAAGPLLVLGSLSFAAWASNDDKAGSVVVCTRVTRSVVACGLAKGKANRRVITRHLKRRVQRNWTQKKRAKDDTETVFAESSLTQLPCHGTEEYVFHEVLRQTLYGEIRCASGSMSGVLVAVKIYAKEAIDRLSYR